MNFKVLTINFKILTMKRLILFLIIYTKSESVPFNNYSLFDSQVTRIGKTTFQLTIPTQKVITLKEVDSVFVDNVKDVIAVEGEEEERDGIQAVQGIVINDHFTGHLTINDDLFYIEPAVKYQLGTAGVLYKARDVTEKQNYAKKKLNNKNTKHIENIKYEKINDTFQVRVSEALKNKKGGPGGNICMLEITIDKFLFSKLGNEKVKVDALIQRHVATLNKVYARNNIRVNNKQIVFKVKNVVIHSQEFCDEGNRRHLHVACRKWYLNSDDSFLEAYAGTDHSAYCLSFLMTTHNFHTTLGVAYKGTMCKKFKYVNLNGGLKMLSPNTGFITLHGSTTDATSEQTFCHEVGHSLGANHDQEDGCKGGFLMDDTTKGLAKTLKVAHSSYTFSTCSRTAIEKAMTDFERDPERQCLVISESSVDGPSMLVVIFSIVILLLIIALVLVVCLFIKRRKQSKSVEPDIEKKKYNEFSNKAFITDHHHQSIRSSSSQSNILPSSASPTRRLQKSPSSILNNSQIQRPSISYATTSSPSSTLEASSALWMVGEMSRERAERQMMNKKVGEFLVRKSQGAFVLTVVNTGRFSHVKIDNSKDGYTIDRVKYFNTILDMVSFYINNPITTVGVRLILDHPSNL